MKKQQVHPASSNQFPEGATVIDDLSITALRDAYRAGTTTPAAVCCEILERCANFSHHNIWITLLDEAQIDSYIAQLDGVPVDELPLWGIPFAIKDNIDLADIPTTAACPAYTYTPVESAAVVTRLLAAGAIPIGKTNLDQFATGLVGTRSPYGAVANAIDPDYISGGSSAGSAVAVALGLCSFALGTDTAGSGRVPAAMNGIIGLKPSPGAWSNRGVVPACASLDCVSVFTTTTADANTINEICTGDDPTAPYSRLLPPRNLDISSPRLGSLGDEALATCQPGIQAAYKQALATLPGTPLTIDFSPFSEAANLLYAGPWIIERQLAVGEFIREHPDEVHPVTREIIGGAAPMAGTAVFDGLYQLQALKKQAAQCFKDIDILVVPSIPAQYTISEVQADPIATNTHLGTYTNFVNLLDLCAVAIPLPGNADELPTGITLIAPAGCDDALLRYAAQITGEDLPAASAGRMPIAVCGAHLDGQPLNADLRQRGGQLLRATRTAPGYRLYALPDGKRPALVRDPAVSDQIEIEIWSLPDAAVAGFLRTIAPPLGLGSILVEDGQWVNSFIAEGIATDGAEEITHYGGWRAYRAENPPV